MRPLTHRSQEDGERYQRGGAGGQDAAPRNIKSDCTYWHGDDDCSATLTEIGMSKYVIARHAVLIKVHADFDTVHCAGQNNAIESRKDQFGLAGQGVGMCLEAAALIGGDLRGCQLGGQVKVVIMLGESAETIQRDEQKCAAGNGDNDRVDRGSRLALRISTFRGRNVLPSIA